MPTPNQKSSQHSRVSLETIDREAHSIWHITELLSKLGCSPPTNQPNPCCDGELTLTSATIQHVAKQISDHVSNIMEHIDALDLK